MLCYECKEAHRIMMNAVLYKYVSTVTTGASSKPRKYPRLRVSDRCPLFNGWRVKEPIPAERSGSGYLAFVVPARNTRKRSVSNMTHSYGRLRTSMHIQVQLQLTRAAFACR